MKIAVIVKTDLDDPKVYTTHRSKVSYHTDNLFLSQNDKNAIEYALDCVKNKGGEVDAFTFEKGILADRVLHEALAMRVNTATKVAGVDVYDPLQTTTIAKEFADYVKKNGNYDLIISGCSDEADPIEAYIAKDLGMNFIDHVAKVDKEYNFESNLEKGRVTGKFALPSVLTVLDSINTPHLPSFIDLRDALSAKINEITISSNDEQSKIVADQTKRKQVIFDLHQDPDAVQKLVDVLKEDGILK